MKVKSAVLPAAFTGGGIGDWRSRIGVTVAKAVAGALMLGENSTIHLDLCDVFGACTSTSGAGSSVLLPMAFWNRPGVAPRNDTVLSVWISLISTISREFWLPKNSGHKNNGFSDRSRCAQPRAAVATRGLKESFCVGQLNERDQRPGFVILTAEREKARERAGAS